MWKCLRCSRQVEPADGKCPTCGGILEEVPDGQSLDESSFPPFTVVPTRPPRGILWLLAAHVVVGLIGARAVNLGGPSAPLVNFLFFGVINDCIAQAGIRHVLTSRTFMDRIKIELAAEPVYLEELRSQVTWADKLCSFSEAYAMPARMLARRLKLLQVRNADLATVIFTSGATELSPLATLNIPPSRSSGSAQVERKEGTVGRLVLGVSAKVTDVDTGAELGPNQSGMLWIKGPNVMQGYLGREDLTAQVIRDGWYMTGDIALIDEDGFIQITGRQSRFSKIGGEMVPHIRVEETLARILGLREDEPLQVAVTAVPDERKGERLVVLHTKIGKTPDELRKGLAEAGLPNLYIPSTDSYHEVAEIPILGSGKLDLQGIKSIASEVFGEPK